MGSEYHRRKLFKTVLCRLNEWLGVISNWSRKCD